MIFLELIRGVRSPLRHQKAVPGWIWTSILPSVLTIALMVLIRNAIFPLSTWITLLVSFHLKLLGINGNFWYDLPREEQFWVGNENLKIFLGGLYCTNDKNLRERGGGTNPGWHYVTLPSLILGVPCWSLRYCVSQKWLFSINFKWELWKIIKVGITWAHILGIVGSPHPTSGGGVQMKPQKWALWGGGPSRGSTNKTIENWSKLKNKRTTKIWNHVLDYDYPL